MSGEQAQTLPEELSVWVDQRADEQGIDREDLLVRAVTVYRLVDDEHTSLGDVGERQALLRDEVDSLDSRVEAVEADLAEKVEDVRSRVIQVKRETDGKASADHSHEELADRVEAAGRTATEALDRLSALDDDLTELDGRLDSGFENYENVLSYLQETTEGLEDDVTRLAHVLVDVRTRMARLDAAATEQAVVDELRRTANRRGITNANCEDCRTTVHLGLLTEPRCPHCERGFLDVEPAGGLGLLRSPTLTTGERPALDGETIDAEQTPRDLFESDSAQDETDKSNEGDDG